ncbi:MAG: beta-ketoacyl synthase N-terminal-like domain-containing protein, partial [Desulfobacteraceae bacterium]
MEKIAVVGVSCLFPGAETFDGFAANVMAKQESIVNVPEDRWILPKQRVISKDNGPDKAFCGRAGLVDGFNFDPSGMAVDPDLLCRLDPLHKMVLHTGREAARSCYTTNSIRERTGVVLAAISLPTDSVSELAWEILLQQTPRTITRADALAASVVSTPAALLARAMGYFGGCCTLDAACASSLYAVKLACDELLLNRADMMVCGGVSRPDAMYTQIGFTQLQALSRSGRCAPFDRDADGLVVGEGAGIMVLKRLSDAVACGDKIFGVIAGAGLSNDIGGNLVAPASDGQVRAMEAAYRSAGWHPSDVQFMECHGSGTAVGDLVETSSIKTLRENSGSLARPLAIGSVKSMTGHLLTAAGAAGMFKVLAGFAEKTLPPSLHFSLLPDNSPLHNCATRVQTEPERWQPEGLTASSGDAARRAAVSAFGFGGINAHLLVEEFTPNTPKSFPGITTTAKLPCSDDEENEDRERGIAIVGMETVTTRAQDLNRFREMIFGIALAGETTAESPGFFTHPGEFHIPPNQIHEILPQHIIMLKAAKGALLDAGITPRPDSGQPERTRFGAAIGIGFDHRATDFFLRWKTALVDETLQESVAPGLNANRTLGALGGIAASRIAREFKLGGPCFTISADTASGIKAVEAGINSLRSGETDLFICGAVDMAGDPRQQALDAALTGKIDPGNGPAPGGNDGRRDGAAEKTAETATEGAAAIVIKRLDRARADNDRIYAIVRGVGGASGGEMAFESPKSRENLSRAWAFSLEKSLSDAEIPPRAMPRYRARFSETPSEDGFEKPSTSISGITALIKTALTVSA